MRRNLVSLFCFALVGCGASQVQAAGHFSTEYCPNEPVAAGDVRFCGAIDEAAVSAIEAAIQSGAKRLIVTSPGGREDIAIRISKTLESASVGLVFDKLCLSACAHFLFLPASAPHVMPNTFIGFHHTNASQALLRAREDLPDHDRFVQLALQPVNEAVAFYNSRSLPPAWLVEPTIRTNPTCVVAEIDWSNPKYPIVGYDSEYEYWVPAREMIERFGRDDFTGFWPDTPEAVRAMLDFHAGQTPVGEVKIGGPTDFTTDVGEIDKLPFCAAADP